MLLLVSILLSINSSNCFILTINLHYIVLFLISSFEQFNFVFVYLFFYLKKAFALVLLVNHTGIILDYFVPSQICDIHYYIWPLSLTEDMTLSSRFREVSSFEMKHDNAGLSNQLSTHRAVESESIVTTWLYWFTNMCIVCEGTAPD